MSNKTSYEDITMTDSYDNSFVGLFSSFNYKPCKRTYLEMMNESGQSSINNRIDKFKIMNKNEKILENKISESISNKNSIEQGPCYLNINKRDIFYPLDFKTTKKNLIVKKKWNYDEEKEKKFVENYYKIKNAELIKLRFGSN